MKVNLGCGRIVRPGFVNVDRYPHEGVDVVHDLDQVPWPFPDESVDYIWASHVLEHVASLERTIREVHRILRVGGVLEVRVPYGIKSLFNPFHLRAFDRTSFDLFAKMDLGYQSQAWFRVDTRVVRGLPKEWHLRRYMPRIFGHLDGWRPTPRWRFIIGRRREVHATLTKVVGDRE